MDKIIPLDKKIIRCKVLLNNKPMSNSVYRHFSEKDVSYAVKGLKKEIDELSIEDREYNSYIYVEDLLSLFKKYFGGIGE
jgi:hypothetical protein